MTAENDFSLTISIVSTPELGGRLKYTVQMRDSYAPHAVFELAHSNNNYVIFKEFSKFIARIDQDFFKIVRASPGATDVVVPFEVSGLCVEYVGADSWPDLWKILIHNSGSSLL